MWGLRCVLLIFAALVQNRFFNAEHVALEIHTEIHVGLLMKCVIYFFPLCVDIN